VKDDAKDWQIKSLEALEEEGAVELGRGKVISKKDLTASPGTFPVYSSAKENEGKFGEYGHFMFDEELITWSVDGGGRLFHRPRHKFSITNVGGFIRILEPSLIDCRYLFFALSYLHSQVSFDWVRKAHPSVIRKVYDQIPLPPLEEQQRIVAILDEAFEGLDRAHAHAEANLRNAQGMFALSFEHELLKYREASTLTTIGEICSGFEYGTSAKSKRSGTIPVLRMGNLQSGEIDWSDLVYTDDEADIQKYALKDGDVLFNRTNSLEHVGKTAIYRGDMPAIFAGYLIRIHFDQSEILPDFLNLFLNSAGARAYGRSISGKSVNQANISASKLKTYPIQLPSFADQKTIVRKAENIRQPLSDLAESYLQKIQDIDDLRQSLLQKAFSGELTAREFA
jgi:restriction endonuclease S subunit